MKKIAQIFDLVSSSALTKQEGVLLVENHVQNRITKAVGVALKAKKGKKRKEGIYEMVDKTTGKHVYAFPKTIVFGNKKKVQEAMDLYRNGSEEEAIEILNAITELNLNTKWYTYFKLRNMLVLATTEF